MTRPSLLVPTLAIAALLVAAPAATAAVDPKTLSAEASFELPASNGLHAHLDVFNEEFTLEIKDRHGYASYEVDGEANETGLKARFGKLGVIDLVFHPTETELDKPPSGCSGPPSRFNQGLLVGTVAFTGEREYVRIDTTQVETSLNVWREGEWHCPRHKRRVRHREAPRTLLFSTPSRVKPEEPATLVAAKRGCRCGFVAYSFPGKNGGGSSFFYGARFEEKEKMEITRVTGRSAGGSAFTANYKAGTASVHPRSPLTGSGHFERRPHARDLWRSNIRVPLLGARPIDMREGGYRAVLINELPEFR